MSQPIKNLHQRIIEVMKEVQTVVKDTDVEVSAGRTYAAVSHDAVTSALHMAMAKAGIVVNPTVIESSLSQFEKSTQWQNQPPKISITYRADIKLQMTFMNADDPKDTMTSVCPGYAFDSGDKAIGKAYSMAQKFILLKTFMLESMDEEESREIEREWNPPPPPPKKAAPKPAATSATAPPAAPKPAATVAPPNNAPISAAQQQAMFKMSEAMGIKTTEMQGLLKRAFNLDQSAAMKVYQYDTLMMAMKTPNFDHTKWAAS